MAGKNLQERFLELVDKNKDSLEFKLEELLYDITEEIYKRMENLGMSQQDLARKLGVSSAYVSKILRGNENISLKTLLKVALALDLEVELYLKPLDKRSFRFKKREAFAWTNYKKVFEKHQGPGFSTAA